MNEASHTRLLIHGYSVLPDRLAPVVDAAPPGAPHAGGGISRLTVRVLWCYAVFVVFAQLLFAGSALAQGAAPDRRIALIIGNSAYRQSPLTNPVNDAQAMAATLGSLGF